MHTGMETYNTLFYDNSILSGTKILCILVLSLLCFTITQFFQVLKYLFSVFFRHLRFTITQFFQVLKSTPYGTMPYMRFTITQFFQVLKYT